ncbi:MAG: peptidoglycan-binding protein [Treponema sp.]|jgi:hypothetical protein|nr:peptidoglycan-binding protein [Treponema sp.]
MTCHDVMDKIYEYSGGEPAPLLLRARIGLHLFFCPSCAQEFERFEVTCDILKNDFFPPAPGLQEPVMRQIMQESAVPAEDGTDGDFEEFPAGVEGVSFRGWVITGLVVLLSLSTACLGLDFGRLAASEGMSFLLPVGITIGAVLTGYGALFIGSHLKQLSERFGLR